MGVYYEVVAERVDPAARHVAHEALRIACLDLHIPDAERPAVRWFSVPTEDDRKYIALFGEHFAERLESDGVGELLGRTVAGSNTVWLRVTTDLASLAETVGHETAHLAIRRQRGGGWSPREHAFQEAAADRYGRHFLEEDL